MMNSKISPILAMHGHVASRGFVLFMVFLACTVIILCWPGKSQSK